MAEGVAGLARTVNLLDAATQRLAAAEAPAERAAAAERLLGIGVEEGSVAATREALVALVAAQRALGHGFQALVAEAELALLDGDFRAHRVALTQLEAALDPEDVEARAEIAERIDRAVDLEIRDRVERGDLDGALQQLHLRYEDLLAAGAAPDRLLHVRELASEVATRKLAGALETAEAAVRVPLQTRTSGVAADPRELPTGLEARAKANPSPGVRAGTAEVAAARGLTSPTARGLTSPTARGRAELAAWARREVPGDPEAHQLLRRELSLADQLQRAGDLDGARAVLDSAAEAVRGVETHEALVANRRLGLELAHGNRTELGRALGDVRRSQKSLPPEEAFLAAQGRFLELEAQLSLGTLDRERASESLFALAQERSSGEDPRLALLEQRIRLRAAMLTEGARAESEARALFESEQTDPQIAAAAGLLAASAALERGDPREAARRLLTVQHRFPAAAQGLAHDPRFAPLIDDQGRFFPKSEDLGAALMAALAESGSGPALRTLLFAGIGLAVGGPVGAAAGLAADRAVAVAEGFDHVAGAYATGLTKTTGRQLSADLFMLGAETATLGAVAAAAIAGRTAGKRLAAHALRSAGVALGAGPVRGMLAAGGIAGEAVAGTAAASSVEALRTGERFRWRPEDALLWMAGRAAATQLSNLQWGSRAGESLRQTFRRESMLAGQTAAVDLCLRAALAQAGVRDVLPNFSASARGQRNLLEHADAQAKAFLLVALLGRGVSGIERAARRADEASARIASDAARPPPPMGPQLAQATAPAGPIRRPPPLSAEGIGRGSLLGQVALRKIDGDLRDPKVRWAVENHVDRRLKGFAGKGPEALAELAKTAGAKGWPKNAVTVLAERAALQLANSARPRAVRSSQVPLERLLEHRRVLMGATGGDHPALRSRILDAGRERIQDIDKLPTEPAKVEAVRDLRELLGKAGIPLLEAFSLGNSNPSVAANTLDAMGPAAASAATKNRLFAQNRAKAAADTIRTEATEAAWTEYVLELGRSGDPKKANNKANKAAQNTAKAAMERIAPAEDAAVFDDAVANGTIFAQQLDAKVQVSLAAYNSGTTGQRIRALMPQLAAQNEAGVRALMAKEVAAGRAVENPVPLTSQPPQTMTVWELTDGSVVRLKPKGDGFRKGPTVSGEVKLNPSLPDNAAQLGGIAFKLDNQGRPIPKDTGQLRDLSKHHEQADRLERMSMDAGHIQL